MNHEPKNITQKKAPLPGAKKLTPKVKRERKPRKLTNAEFRAQRFEAEKPEPQKKDFHFELHKIGVQEPNKKYTCHFNGYAVGLNEGGEHAYFKKLFCGREWCECCGHDGSITHQRRISRIFPKIMPLNNVGYLVVTIPSFLREQFYNVKALKDFKEYWKRKIKRDLSRYKDERKGLIRYHWAGEDGTTWKPHLNILIDKGFIQAEQIERWRHELKVWFKNYFKLAKAPAPNIFYRYTNKDGEKYHKIKYITRATMLKFPDIRTKDFFLKDLKNFKNTTIFGKFPKSEELLTAESQKIYVNNKCAFTGQKIIWKYYIKDITKVIHKKHLEDKGLGIFHAYSCYAFFKDVEELSNFGRVRKPQKIIQQENFAPGEHIKNINRVNFFAHQGKFLIKKPIFYKAFNSLVK